MPHSSDDCGTLEDLQHLSSRIGAKPLLIQGAGGNTSLKRDDRIWVKASGKWLCNAESEPMFVPLDLKEGKRILGAERDDFSSAVLRDCPAGLRPSIETSLHIALPQPVVIHVHCVNTLAWAVRQDGMEKIGELLDGTPWCWVPYRRPGMDLTRAIRQYADDDTSVLILANHGLVIAADSVLKAENLLREVTEKLDKATRPSVRSDFSVLEELAERTGLRLPLHEDVHTIACDPISLNLATRGSLYPDHVVFLGRGMPAAEDPSNFLPEHGAVAVPGKGVLVRSELSRGGEEMLLCLANVCRRIESDSPIRTLTDAEELALMTWDAEKFRKSI
jgi:rhamnose utilization protein RhaD (predicted bifunctional aldolase and dehydrogenase)